MTSQGTTLRNSFIVGFVPGLLGPVIGAFLFWYSKYKDLYGFWTWLEMAYQKDILVMVVALGAVVNLLFFFGFLQFKWYWSGRATMYATLLYAILVIILKLS